MKTKSKISMTFLVVTAAFGLQACNWGVNGVDRMEERFGTDAVEDAVSDAAEDVVESDVLEDTATTDLHQEDTAIDDVAGDTSVGTDANVWPDVSYEGIEGLWVGRLVSNGRINVVLEELPMTTTDLFLVEGSASGLTMTFCDELIKVVPGEMISNTTDTMPALRDAIASTPIELPVSGDKVPAQEIVWRWALAETIGDNDPLPAVDKKNEAANLANYPDIDNDTHPGVTIAVSVDMGGNLTTGQRYMAKRAKFSLAEGTLSGDGRWITGTMTFAVDEVVLGADQPLLNNGATVVPSEEGTFYQFRRVDETMDCQTLIEGHESLFAEAP